MEMPATLSSSVPWMEKPNSSSGMVERGSAWITVDQILDAAEGTRSDGTVGGGGNVCVGGRGRCVGRARRILSKGRMERRGGHRRRTDLDRGEGRRRMGLDRGDGDGSA